MANFQQSYVLLNIVYRRGKRVVWIFLSTALRVGRHSCKRTENQVQAASFDYIVPLFGRNATSLNNTAIVALILAF